MPKALAPCFEPSGQVADPLADVLRQVGHSRPVWPLRRGRLPGWQGRHAGARTPTGVPGTAKQRHDRRAQRLRRRRRWSLLKMAVACREGRWPSSTGASGRGPAPPGLVSRHPAGPHLTRGFCVDTRPLPARSNKAPGSGRGRCALLLRPRFPRTRAEIGQARGRAWRPGTPRAGSETETGWASRAAVRNSPIPRRTAAGRRRSPQFARKAAPLDRWPDGRASFRTQPMPAARNHAARPPPFSF